MALSGNHEQIISYHVIVKRGTWKNEQQRHIQKPVKH